MTAATPHRRRRSRRSVSGLGIVYALVDPRDSETRYIGETVRSLADRLAGHMNSRVPRIRAWIAELREAGLKPLIIPLRADVPIGELVEAEREEITRIVAAGGVLLNEMSTSLGRELHRQRRLTERVEAERAAWRDLAAIALEMLGGPLPPGDYPRIDIPDVAWSFMAKVEPGHAERVRSLIGSGQSDETRQQRHELFLYSMREQEEAIEELWRGTSAAWDRLLRLADNAFSERMKRHFALAAETPGLTRADASRLLVLIVWYMVAVDPWRHLAELADLPLGDASFIEWAGQDAGTREALEFLAARGENYLTKLSARQDDSWDKGPGHLLGVVTAAYSEQAYEALRPDLTHILRRFAEDHMLTGQMLDRPGFCGGPCLPDMINLPFFPAVRSSFPHILSAEYTCRRSAGARCYTSQPIPGSQA